MRALHLTRDLPPATKGGLSIAVAGLLVALRDAGVVCATISYDAWRPGRGPSGAQATSEWDDLGVLRVHGPAEADAACRLAEAWQPDVICVHDAMLWDAAESLRSAAPRVLYVHVLHSEMNRLRGVASTQSSVAEARALERADGVVAPSAAVIERLSRSANVRLAPLGLTPRPYPTRDPQPGVVLYVGRFDPIKGTDRLAGLASALPQVRVRVAGGLPANVRSTRRWSDQLSAAGCEVLGWLPDPAAARASAALQVVPSRFETFGLAALEAMASGAPVVVTDAGALPELLQNGVTGVIVPAADEVALRRAVQRLLDDPTAAEALGAAARAEVASRWLWPQRVTAHLEALRAR